ncbi:MAG: hypothetical protein ACRDGA_02815, partial [Bacteroidota bacterium]
PGDTCVEYPHSQHAWRILPGIALFFLIKPQKRVIPILRRFADIRLDPEIPRSPYREAVAANA